MNEPAHRAVSEWYSNGARMAEPGDSASPAPRDSRGYQGRGVSAGLAFWARLSAC
jgi:hypothetical protein